MNFCRKVVIRIIITAVISMLFIGCFFSGGVLGDNQEVQLSIFPRPKIDIILAKSRTQTDVTNFENSIISALSNLQVDTTDVKVSSVEAETVNLEKSFSWNQDLDTDIGSIKITNNGQDVEMKGNQTNAGKNAMWIVPDENQEQEFTFDYNIDFGDSFNAAGMLLRVKETGNNQLSGYMLSFNKPGRSEYYVPAGNQNGALWEFTYDGNNRTNMNKTFVKSIPFNTSGKLTVKATDTTIKVSGGSLSQEFEYTIPDNKTSITGNGYGFFSDHYSHGCADWGSFTLSNINLKAAVVKSFNDVLRVPEWREDAYKIFVYIEDGENEELKDTNAMGELLTRLLDEDIYFVGWGTAKNQTQMQGLVKSNNNKGTFVNNTGFQPSINATAQYIKTLIDNIESSEYILVDEPIAVEVTPAGIDKNSKDEQWPYGKWMVDHNHTFFENNMGQFVDSGKLTNDMIRTFDKTGRYEITYCNQNITPKYIYVHRKPVAEITMQLSGTTVSLDGSNSYDLDLQSQSNGIAQEEWKWKEVEGTDWHVEKMTSRDTSKSYIVQLRVKDHQGEWSAPATKYITNDSEALPVARFNFESNKISKYEPLEVKDASYDPVGRRITTWLWEVYKGDQLVYSGAEPLKNYNDANKGVGEYKMYLTVTNEANKKSERFGRAFTVTNDIIAPEVVAMPTKSEWTQSVTVNLNFTDKGGSQFRGYQYAITDDQATPSQWSIEKNLATDNIVITDEGQKYLHLRGFDNDGNESTERILGQYKVDHSPPTITPTADFQTITTNPITVNIQTTDAYSGVQQVTVNDQPLQNKDNNTYTINKNGTYTIKAVDIVGNEKTETLNVTNIYQHCTAELGHPDFSTSLESCPICDLIEGLEVTNDTVTYNSHEQRVTINNPHSAEIVEYYNGNKTYPVEQGTYEYDLKVKYQGQEYNTGKTGTFTINKKVITITDIDAEDREYDGTNVVKLKGGRLVGVEETDIPSVGFTLPATGTTNSKNVGEYDVKIPEIVLTGDKAHNYTLTQPAEDAVNVIITKKTTIIPDTEEPDNPEKQGAVRVVGITATNRIYNGTTTVQLNRGKLVGIEDVDKDKVDYELSETGTSESKDVGVHNVTVPEITLTGAEASNYQITQPAVDEVKVEITQKELTIVDIVAVNRKYNSTDVVELQGGRLVGIEDVDNGKVNFILPQTGTSESKDIGTHNVTIPEITLDGEEAKNYTLKQPTPEEVKVEITQKEITIVDIVAVNRKYNSTNIVELQGGRLVGVEEIDNGKVNFILPQTGTSESKDIGTHNVTIAEITLEGEEAKNYTLKQPTPEEVKVEITQKEINIVDIEAIDRQYDSTNIVELQGGRLVGVEEIDNGKVNFILPQTGTIDSKDIGEYNVTISEIKLEGEEAKNYTLIQPLKEEVNVTITQKEINIVDIEAIDRQYDSTNIVTLQGGRLVGVEEIDNGKVNFILPQTGTIDSKDIGEYNVTISEIKLEGEEAKNYTLIQPLKEEVNVTITQKEITIVDIVARNRQYDSTDIVYLYGGKLVGVEESDIGKVKYILSRIGKIPSKNIGEYNVILSEITLTGEESKNYKLIQPAEDAVKVKISKKGKAVEEQEIPTDPEDLERPEEPDVKPDPNDPNNIPTDPEDPSNPYGRNGVGVIGIESTDREYDGTNIVQISGGSLVGIEEADKEKVTFIMEETGTTESKDIGEYNVVIPEIKLDGEEANNYEITQPPEDYVKVNIEKRHITIEGIKGVDRKFDKTNVVEIAEGELVNVVEGEDVKAVYPETGTIPEIYTGEYEVTIEEITLQGEDIDNYELIQPEHITVTISRPDEPEFELETHISAINGDEGQLEKIRFNDEVEISMTITNNGLGIGYVQKIINEIPEGLEFIPDNQINKEYGWTDEGNNTVETEQLNFDYGEENEIEPAENGGYRELQLVLKVTEEAEPQSQLENITKINDIVDTEGNKVEEHPEIEEILEMEVSCTDFSIDENITKIAEIRDSQVYDHTVAPTDGKLAKAEIHRKNINSTSLQVTYQIDIANEGKETGNVEKVIVAIPYGMSIEPQSSSSWIASGNNAIYENIGEIDAGDTQTLELVLQCNAANITGETNSQAVLMSNEDIDQVKVGLDSVTEENALAKLSDTNNYSESDMIISIKTGGEDFTEFIWFIVAIFAIGIFGIRLQFKR